MNITAISVENLEENGLGLLPNKMELEVRGNIFPDTYWEWIGRYDKTNDKLKSFFKKDKEAGNTHYFDEYRKKYNLYEKHRTVFNREDCTEKNVVDYYVMYNILESSKFKPTIIEDHVDHSCCMNGSFKCEYELLFACDGAIRRIIVPFTSVNIPMYEFIGDLEDMIEEVLDEESDESNPFNDIFRDGDGYYEITMFDEIGVNCDIEVESASDFMAMLVSVRLVGYEFIENGGK